MGGKASRGYELDKRALTQQESNSSILTQNHNQLASDQSYEQLETRSFLKRKNQLDESS